jgi:lysophospholipase L1-like esterase
MPTTRRSLLLSIAATTAAVTLSLLPARAQTTAPDPSHKPTLFIIGDSTVKNGADNGSNGQWGWGHFLGLYFDPAKISVENDALGGTSSRSFFETPNLFPKVIDKVHAGDYVLMQFGHNDNTRPPQSDTLRYRSTISGNGEETVEGPKDPKQGGGNETIHSFGWYMRQMISQIKAKGATPIVCSLIPRDNWRGDKIGRADQGYGLWAKQAADQEKAPFLPLNTLIADRYDKEGKEKVMATYFPQGETTHTNWAGAVLNADCVVEGIKQLDLPLKNFLLPTPPKIPDAPPAR